MTGSLRPKKRQGFFNGKARKDSYRRRPERNRAPESGCDGAGPAMQRRPASDRQSAKVAAEQRRPASDRQSAKVAAEQVRRRRRSDFHGGDQSDAAIGTPLGLQNRTDGSIRGRGAMAKWSGKSKQRILPSAPWLCAGRFPRLADGTFHVCCEGSHVCCEGSQGDCAM